MKTVEREQARALRREGQSIKEISHALNVSKGSVSVWVRDIVLTESQTQALYNRRAMSAAQGRGARGVSDKYMKLRYQYQLEGRAKAREGNALHFGA